MTWDTDGFRNIDPDDLRRWRATYKCDVDLELMKMDCWLRSNPRKARKSNWSRFVVNWLARAKPMPRKAETFGLITGQMPDVMIFE